MPFLGKFPTQIVDPEVDIDGGAIDGVTIGATTASAATVTTLTSGNITTTGYIAGPSTFTIDPAAVGDNTGTLVVAGNLQVDGTTTTINSTTMTVDDLNITLASGAANAAAADGAGITVDGASATLTYNSTPDAWSFNKNVGIGTASPATPLHIKGTTAAQIRSEATTGFAGIHNTNSSGNFYHMIDNSTGAGFSSGAYARVMYSDGAYPMAFYTNANERMRIDSIGRLLLGCTTSNGSYISSNHTQISIQGQASGAIGSIMLRSQGTTNATAFELAASDGVAESYLWNGSVSAMVFGTSNIERMRIDSSGNVGFGTSSPGARLDIQTPSYATSTTAGMIKFNDSVNTHHCNIQSYHVGGQGSDIIVGSNAYVNTAGGWTRWTSSYGGAAIRYGREGVISFLTNTSAGVVSEGVRIDSSGNVGIGTASPDVKLHIQGSNGAVNPSTYSVIDLAIEDNSEAALGIIGNNYSSIYFGDAANVLEAGIVYNHTTNKLELRGSGNTSDLTIDASGNVGIGTASPYTPLNIRTSNSLGSTFTGSTRGEGVTVEQSSYTADNYVSLIEAPYAANAAPAARIGVKFNGSGSWLTLGTSNNYATGITNATMVINPNGDVTIDGHVTISDGVYIGGTATGNHLDDYEEGTYTPTYSGSSTSGTTTYSVQTGVYTKVGRTVTVWVDMTITAMSGASGVPYISLPFTSGTSYGTDIYGNTRYDMGAFIAWQTSDNLTVTSRPTGWITNNSGFMQMYRYTTAGTGGLAQWALNTTGRISGKIIYTSAF